jgi:hypothetical protein
MHVPPGRFGAFCCTGQAQVSLAGEIDPAIRDNEAVSIVFHLQAYALNFQLEAHDYLAGIRMTHDIRQRLLVNAEERQAYHLRQHFVVRIQVEMDLNLGVFTLKLIGMRANGLL